MMNEKAVSYTVNLYIHDIYDVHLIFTLTALRNPNIHFQPKKQGLNNLQCQDCCSLHVYIDFSKVDCRQFVQSDLDLHCLQRQTQFWKRDLRNKPSVTVFAHVTHTAGV